MDIEHYRAQQYDWPPCWQLVADVYASELDTEVADFKTINGTIRAIAQAFRIALHKGEHGFRQSDEPQDYAVVLMGKMTTRPPHHCGIYYQGRVIHATKNGVLDQDLASLSDQYPRLEFWTKA